MPWTVYFKRLILYYTNFTSIQKQNIILEALWTFSTSSALPSRSTATHHLQENWNFEVGLCVQVARKSPTVYFDC